MHRLSLRIAAALAAVLMAAPSAPAAITSEQREFFEQHIRPVLAQQCFICHTNSAMGGLRLDSRERMLAGGASGKPVVVPGEPEKSRLITAIRQTTELRMPKRGTRLTDQQVERFVEWIADDAPWPEDFSATGLPGELYQITEEQRNFWSFQPLADAAPPDVENETWPETPIDRFVLAEMEDKGLTPAPDADKRTLLRRLYYDLTGLPPSYEDVRTFEADSSPDAYEKVVDKLLASPQYGEKWGRHWLDVVRYSEDDYNVSAKPDRAEHYPNAYTYRDWVIEALNQDLDYDTFVKAQLAADQFKDQELRKEMIPALGMNGLGVWQFAASPPPIMRADEWHDKVDATTKAFLGLTVGCARCHDHKYDPIPTKDYYRLAGVFASSEFHAYPLVDEEEAKKYDDAKEKLDEMEEDLEEFEEEVAGLYAKILFSQTEKYMLAAYRLGSEKKAHLDLIAAEERLDEEVLSRWVRFLQKKPSNYSYLVEWQKMVDSNGTPEEAKELAARFYAEARKVVELYDEISKENEMTLLQAKGGDEEEDFDPMPNGKKRKLNPYQIDLKGLEREQSYLYQDMFDKDLAANQGDPTADEPDRPGLFKFEGWALEKRLGAEWMQHIQAKRHEIEAFKEEMPEPHPFVYGIGEGDAYNLSVFIRGDPYTFGEEAPRAFLKVFAEPGEEPEPFTEGSGRLELAEAILEQPLTARVIANRLWRWTLGVGLVETPSNFGAVGERPTNPELLDYLAREFQAGGGSWKSLLKEIVSSRVYRLSSEPVETNLAIDADNRYYWRSNRRRLNAEGIWDSLLSVSGRLELSEMGGRSFEFGEEDVARRAVYGNVSRMYMSQFQETFDVPVPTLSAEQRYVTNVPQQRLFFLNDPFVEKQTEAFAARVREQASTAKEQIQTAYRLAYQRDPTAAETAAARELLSQPLTLDTIETASAGAAMGKPEPRADAALNALEDPAEDVTDEAVDDPLETLCWALMASNEFLYVE